MESQFDIVIVGASFGGVSAALAAARYGKRIALIEAGESVGGQATSQGLTRWDEQEGVKSPDTYGSTKSYQALKDGIRRWYRQNATLSTKARKKDFNPGFFDPGHPFSADCRVVEIVIRTMLDAARKNVTLMLGTAVRSADVENGSVRSLQLENGDSVTAAIFVDATDLGELLPMCGVQWFIGAEAQGDTEEPHAADKQYPGHIQPFTVSLGFEHRTDGQPHTIPMPPSYTSDVIADQDFHVYDKRNGWIGGVLTSAHSETPHWETILNYRQYIDSRNFSDPNYQYDRSVLNVGCNDYQNAVIPTGDAAVDATIVEAARGVSLAYFYWLQTEAPHDDDPTRKGYPSLAVRGDIFGRADGTAPQPYIRESRRISNPVVQLLEQHIAVPDKTMPGVRAPMNFFDSCGICYYAADVHKIYGPPGTPDVGGINVRPFQIPMGSLIPKDASNLIAACKNIGGTHVTSAAYRVHPGEWAIGEAAGMLAAYCAGQNVTPAQAHANASRVSALQLRLLTWGAPIFWWSDLDFKSDPKTFAAANLLGVRGFLVDQLTLTFNPGGDIAQSDRDAANSRAGRQLPWPAGSMKRAAAAVWLCAELGLPSSEAVAQWDS